MRLSLLQTESYRAGLTTSSLLNVVAQALVFATGIVMAAYFGTTRTTDVYFYCLTMIALLTSFVSAIDSTVLIPECMRIMERTGMKTAMAFLNTFSYSFLAIGVVITAWIAMDSVGVLRSVSHFDTPLIEEQWRVVYWTIPLVLLQIMAQHLTDVLGAFKFFTLPVLFTILNRGVVLVFLVFSHARLDILSALLGAIVATIMQLLLLIGLMATSLGWFWGRPARVERRIWSNIGFSFAGNVFSAGAGYVPMFLLSSFPAGILTAINYALRLSTLPALLITNQVSHIAGIRLNEIAAQDTWKRLDESFGDILRVLSCVLIPLGALVFLLAQPIAVLCFQRGSFDATSVQHTAAFLGWFALGIPFIGMNTIVSRLFSAARKIKEGVYYQMATNTLMTLLIAGGLTYGGPSGFPVGQSFFYAANVLLVWPLIRLVLPAISYGHVLLDLVVLLGSNVVIGLITWGILSLIPTHAPWVRILEGATLYGAILAAHLWLYISRSRDWRRRLQRLGVA